MESGWRGVARLTGRWLSRAVFPDYCVRCGREGSVVCPVCRLSWLPSPALERFSAATQTLHGLFSVSPYPDPIIKGLLRLWKFHGHVLAERELLTLIEETVNSYSEAWPEPDAVTFVPLHRWRRNERGFDQAERMARLVAESLNRPLIQLLRRRHWTGSQARQKPEQRRKLAGRRAFAIQSPSVLHDFSRLLLVDDVVTTGTTMRSAARVLRQAGVREVWGFTVARG